MPLPVVAGDTIEVTTDTIAYGGDAIARYEGLAVFVPFAAPRERLRVRISEVKKRYARGVIEAILEPSTERREPPCRLFGDCGGCQLQHISYEEQLRVKASFIRDSLSRIAGIDPGPVDVRPSPELAYRTRAQVKVRRDEERVTVGFNRIGSRAVCDVEECPILVPELNGLLKRVRTWASEPGHLSLPDEVYIASGDDGASVEPTLPGLPGGPITRTLADAKYGFNPSSFFQANDFLLEDLVRGAVGEMRGGLAIELHSGVGLFTLQLARLFERVVAVEADKRAVGLMRENLRDAGVENVKVVGAPAEEWLARLISRRAETTPAPDLVLLDPPRTGAAEVVRLLEMLKPRRITYVSCDPATLARDLKHLLSCYSLAGVTGFDLFPQTYHVEIIADLQLRA